MHRFCASVRRVLAFAWRRASAARCLLCLAFLWGVLVLIDPAASAEPRSKQVLALLEQLPMWPQRPFIPDKDEQEQDRQDAAAEITALAAQLDAYSLDEIRDGIGLYTESPLYRPELAFAVTQYVFEIPRRSDPRFRHVRSSFNVWKPSQRDLPESWPWREDENGKLQFEVMTIGLVRNGPPYPALEVFDSYREHFSRRKAKK